MNATNMNLQVSWPELPEIRLAAGCPLSELAMLTSKTMQLHDLSHKALVRVTLHTAALLGCELLKKLYVEIDCRDAEAAQKVVALASDVTDFVSFDALASDGTTQVRFMEHAVKPDDTQRVARYAQAAQIAAERVRGEPPSDAEIAALTLTREEEENLTPLGLHVAAAKMAAMSALAGCPH